MPPRIAQLPRDPRGYPIPWNVLRSEDGTPFFTINDDRRHWEAVRRALCPICGERLGKWKWFCGGPLSAFHPDGWYIDLPMHHECLQYALATCPYLAVPKYLGRVDIVDASKLPAKAKIFLNETMIPERPALFVAVASNLVEITYNAPQLPHTRPQRPALAYEYWRHGKQLTEAEAIPYLRAALGDEWTVPACAGYL